jgi:hypothetical protein
VEAWFRFEDIQGFFAGHLVPAVDQVDKDASSLWREVGGEGLCDESVVLAIGSVGKEIEAATDGKTQLTSGEQEFGKGVGELKGNNGASKTAPDGADADGAEFVEVIRILM